MPRAGAKTTLGSWWWLVSHSPDLVRSSGQRGNWLRLAALSLGRAVGSVRWRVVYLADGSGGGRRA
jgi:hypothetical protein